MEFAATLDFERVLTIETEFVLENIVSRLRNEDSPRLSMGLESACDIDCITPNIIGEPLSAYNSGNHRASADTNA